MKNNIEKLILFPFGGNSREALDAIEAINAIKNRYKIIGFVDDNSDNIKNLNYKFYPIYGRDILNEHINAQVLAVQASPYTFLKRLEIIKSLNLPNDRFATIIHPTAVISSSAKIGRNVLIMAGVVISTDVTIEDNVIILPNSVVSHDSTISNGTCMGSNVSISGYVKIGQECYIGSGAKIINNISINSQTLVGIGSVVINSIEKRGIYAGSPAKFIRE